MTISSTSSPPAAPPAVPDVDAVDAAFAPGGPMTVGLEEELVLLDPETTDLLPRAAEVARRSTDDPTVRLELPASQLEIAGPPAATVGEAVAHLAGARRRLARAAEGIGVLAGMAVHPWAAPEGVLDACEAYAHVREEYGWVARRQLVAALQVHVAVRPAERAVRVHDALRDHLPDIAALAAAAPVYGGVDTGLASVRPKLSEHLPRQGVPPAYGDVEGLVESWAWAHRAGAIRAVGQWWWEARLHPRHGTIEVRVADAQATTAEVGAVAAVVHALCADLAAADEDGVRRPATPRWRIEANRWSACRHGVEGTMADLVTGEPEPTRRRLHRLLERLAPTAERLGCAAELAAAARLVDDPLPARHRAVAAERGADGLARWLAGRLLA